MSKVLRFLVSGILLGILAWRTDWAQVSQAFGHLRCDLWLAAVGLYLLSQVVSSLRWRLLARPLGFERPLRQLLSFYFIGMFFNLFLPTSVGGDVVRAWYLDGRSGRRLTAFLAVFADRFSGLIVLVILACAAVIFCPIALPGRITWSVWATAGGGLLAFVMFPIFIRWTGHLGPVRNVAQSIRLYLGRPRLLLATSGLSLVVQAINVVTVWLVGQAIQVPVPAAYYWIMVPMVSLLTLLPSVNGIGLREGGTIFFLAPLGIADAAALSLAFLWFSVSTAAGLCGGMVYLFGSFPRPEVQAHDDPIGDCPDQGRAGQLKAAA